MYLQHDSSNFFFINPRVKNILFQVHYMLSNIM